MDTQVGLVGYFDILGYQNLLEKNEPEDIAKSVLPLFKKIDTKVIKELASRLSGALSELKLEEIEQALKKSMKWLIFSDTVLLTMPVEDLYSDINWLIFLSACMHLKIKMFQSGLPLRGVINYGKFYIEDTCFAGRTIVEAYQLCNKLDIAACVFTKNAQGEVDRIDKDNSSYRLFNNFIYKYLIPTKGGDEYYYTLAAQTYDIKHDGDIREQVLSSFWAHNKDIPMSAQKLVSNTEQWLCFLKEKKRS